MVYKETGYVHAMAYIVSVLLMYMPEEDALWTMISIMTKYKQKFSKLHTYLIENKVTPSMHATQWFMNLFKVYFPFKC
jgi:hypothetical protein